MSLGSVGGIEYLDTDVAVMVLIANKERFVPGLVGAIHVNIVVMEVNSVAVEIIGLGFYLVLIEVTGEGNGNPLQYSCLENPMDRGAWRATAHGVAKSRTTEQLTHTDV